VIRRLVLAGILMSCHGGDRQPQQGSGSAASPAARRFEEWLAAFNAADRARLVSWHEKNFPYERRPGAAGDVDDELAFREGTGGFDIRKTEVSTATRFVVVVQEKDSDQHARATIELDPAEPHRATKFDILAIPTPDELRIKRLTEAAALDALRAQLHEAVARDRFAGAVLVARNGTPIFAQAYGLADRDKKTPNTLDTQFRIGSMNKMFTATAVLQLVQAGKLSLDDTVGKIDPGYPNKGVASKVTLHHLLTHTGGTGDIFGPDFEAHRLELRTLDDYVKLYGARDLAYEPGSKWEYSNYGFLLLGVLLEHRTGKSYYDWVGEHVFVPAGMTATASLPEDQPVANRSVGYMKKDPKAAWTPNTDTLPYRGTSAGGGYSTVGDLLRFANAVTGQKLLDEKHTKLLTTPKTDTPGGGKYGYGFGFPDDAAEPVHCYGHSGGAPGMNGDLNICDSGYTIVVLSNLDPPAAQRISDFIRQRLPAKAAR
jgi:D-alanyl-D-alanine carboxypeptidase